jgi:hypothetical protein
MKDMTMADSFYGQHLPSLIRLSHARARALSFLPGVDPKDPSTLKYQPLNIDPHRDLVQEWREQGWDTVWGESKEEADEEAERVRVSEEKERTDAKVKAVEKKGGRKGKQ